MMRAAPVPWGAPGLHGAVAIVRLWLWLPNPPLTAGSFPATILSRSMAFVDCTASILFRRGGTGKDKGRSVDVSVTLRYTSLQIVKISRRENYALVVMNLLACLLKF